MRPWGYGNVVGFLRCLAGKGMGRLGWILNGRDISGDGPAYLLDFWLSVIRFLCIPNETYS